MNSLDILIIIVVCLAVLYGFFRGIIREIFSLLGLIGGFVVAARCYHLVAQYLGRWIPSGILAAAVAFILCLVLVMILASMLGSALRSAARQVNLGTHDRMLGSVFGLLKGVLLAAILLILADAVLPADYPAIAQSRLYPHLIRLGEQVLDILPPGWKDSIGSNKDGSNNADRRQDPAHPPGPHVPEKSMKEL